MACPLRPNRRERHCRVGRCARAELVGPHPHPDSQTDYSSAYNKPHSMPIRETLSPLLFARRGVIMTILCDGHLNQKYSMHRRTASPWTRIGQLALIEIGITLA